MSSDARIRFTAETPAELPFVEEELLPPTTPIFLALAREAQPDPLDELRAKVERAELLARQAQAYLRIAVGRAELLILRGNGKAD